MSTPKENFIRLMRNDNPKWLGDTWDCFNQNPVFRPVLWDAVTLSLGGAQRGQTGVIDAWGVTYDFPEDQPGPFPVVTEEKKVIKDIQHWRDFVTFPSFDNVDWSLPDQMFPNLDRENLLVQFPSLIGMFEFSHYMMGFEDALIYYLTEQESMYDLLSAYTDWKINAAGLVIDHMKPDMIHSHDDWGSKNSLFLSPEVWREMIKPHFARYYGYIKSRGVLIQHHNDSISAPLAKDMVDIGMDMWQGVLPQDNIPEIFEQTEGKLCLMGGFDMGKIDLPVADDALIRSEVRRAIDEYMPLGPYIPCATGIYALHDDVNAIMYDELNRYGAIYAEKHF
ncbi:MAG: uroporphyrinogen decarboxylase (URO-D) [Oscillospiraceae bacterium]|nr:uroporphyrinogen decarboxylase (URO-D) [Oscillospiraceae bacterium]